MLLSRYESQRHRSRRKLGLALVDVHADSKNRERDAVTKCFGFYEDSAEFLVLGSEKLGGILIESKTLGDSVSFAILGIGVNINQSKSQLPPGAVSLRLVSRKQHDLRTIMGAILDQIRSSSDDLDNASRIMEEWWHNCIHRPLRVQVTLPKGAVSGISKG